MNGETDIANTAGLERRTNDRESIVSANFRQGTVSSNANALLPQLNRYKDKADLKHYQLHVLGIEKMDTFIVPDMQQILRNLRTAKNEASLKSKSELIDEFEHMSSWRRVFEQIWMQIRWLNSYGHINELGLRKIMKKFAKNFFAIKDNTINKKLSEIIQSKTFQVAEGKMGEELQILSNDLLRFYADCFCKGSVSRAR